MQSGIVSAARTSSPLSTRTLMRQLRAGREEGGELVALVGAELQLERGERRLEVLGAARPDDDRVDQRVGQQPGQRERRHVDAALARHRLEASSASKTSARCRCS